MTALHTVDQVGRLQAAWIHSRPTTSVYSTAISSTKEP